mgnify:CR=1 FL=1|jgi:hypothetical protein
MKNKKETPSANGANDQTSNKSESHDNYTKTSLNYKELCDSIKTTSKENHNGK